MHHKMRCPDCRRPLCQRILSIDDVCADQPKRKLGTYDGAVTGELFNDYSMHDLFSSS